MPPLGAHDSNIGLEIMAQRCQLAFGHREGGGRGVVACMTEEHYKACFPMRECAVLWLHR